MGGAVDSDCGACGDGGVDSGGGPGGAVGDLEQAAGAATGGAYSDGAQGEGMNVEWAASAARRRWRSRTLCAAARIWRSWARPAGLSASRPAAAASAAASASSGRCGEWAEGGGEADGKRERHLVPRVTGQELLTMHPEKRCSASVDHHAGAHLRHRVELGAHEAMHAVILPRTCWYFCGFIVIRQIEAGPFGATLHGVEGFRDNRPEAARQGVEKGDARLSLIPHSPVPSDGEV